MSKLQANKEAIESHIPDLYRTPQEFLEQVTLTVDTSKDIYEHLDSQLYPTSSPDDEYVVIVLQINDERLRNFFGGKYLIQQWGKKRKFFQTVHNVRPNRFFLYKQRFIYSMTGTQEESQWIFIVNFYQQVFNKIKHPLYNKDTFDGQHEIQVFCDAKLMLVASYDKIMWAPFKFEETKDPQNANNKAPADTPSQMQNTEGENDSLDHSQSFNNKTLEKEKKESAKASNRQNLKATPLETNFKSVFSNIEGELPEFLQILDIGFEGFQQKEINLICEGETKIMLYRIQPVKLRKFTVFKITDKLKFDKIGIGMSFGETLHSVKMIQIGDTSNVYLVTKGQGELILVTERQADATQTLAKAMLTKLTKGKHLMEQEEDTAALLGIQDDPSMGTKDIVIKLKSYFIRRQNIYLEEISGQIRVLNSELCKVDKPLNKTSRVNQSKELIQLQEITNHLGFFNDYLIASTTLILAHGKILSIFDFKTSKWSHVLPSQQGSVKKEDFVHDYKESYFGQPEEEIENLHLNYIFQNSIYDCLVLYKGKFLKRLKYFNEVQKTCFEKAVIFKGDEVKQIVKNYDMLLYREYGDSQARTYFMVQSSKTKNYDIFVSENGSQMTKFIRNIENPWIIIKLQNAPSDLLATYEPQMKRLRIYSIQNCRQCLDPAELQKYVKFSIDNWVPKEDLKTFRDTNYFYFKKKLYFNVDGNLTIWKLKKRTHAFKELNFKSSIKDFFMTSEDSVYYKDKNNVFKYANLKIQKVFDISKLPTQLYDCQGAFVQKLDYCLMTNRFACFTSPFKVSITPNVNNYSIDLMSTMNFETNFVFWVQRGRKLHAFKQPNIVVSWDLNTGKVIDNQEFRINLKGFTKMTDWNGTTLLKQVRDQDYKPENDDVFAASEEERKQRMLFPHKQLFSLVDINDDGVVSEICRFQYDLKIGQTIYVSYPYALLMDNECTKFFILDSKDKTGKFRHMKFDNTFYEPQMKVGKPTYFSPDFHYRLYIDTDLKQVVLANTVMNTECLRIEIYSNLMFQKLYTHPMIYFHNNDSIVYLTVQGVEKVFEIVKTQKKKRTLYSLKEIANCFYSRKDFIRRILIDNLNFKKELSSQVKHEKMLMIRATIIKRGLLLNEYLLHNSNEEKKQIQPEYPDNNIGNFNYFIVDCFRRELNFSYLIWKVIEQIRNKKLSILSLEKHFVRELIFTILPNQETILHNLNDNFEELDNFLKMINEVPMVEDIGAKKRKKKLENDIEINDLPFLPNLSGHTPLHISIKQNNTRFTDRIVTELAVTDFDHHSRFIIDQLPYLIEQVPQALGIYLENRQRLTNWVTRYTRGKLEVMPECEFMMASDQMWSPQIHDTLPHKIFNPEVVEQPINMFVLDLPNYQKYDDKHADHFLEVLSGTDNIDLFTSASVRAMIELKWPAVRKAMIKYLLTPYLILLVTFIYYSMYLFETLQEAEAEEAKKTPEQKAKEAAEEADDGQFWTRNQKFIAKCVILGITFYFFSLELKQFYSQGIRKYFTSHWNYIDMIPYSLITCGLLVEFLYDFPQTERAINSISIFFLWIKCLYFLRMNRASSKFISMIVAVITDMRIFLAVFIVSLVTFSQSLYILSNNNPDEEKQFISSFADSILFTYRISLGDWETGELGETDMAIIFTLFIMSTLFLQVVMLNLLIAIISDTYARVEETSQNELYKNFSDLIIENEYLVPKSQIVEHDNAGSYLYIAKIDTNESSTDKWEQTINDLKRTMILRTTIVDRVAKDFAKQLNNQLQLAQDKFQQFFTEETNRSELKYKSILKKIDKSSPMKQALEGAVESMIQPGFNRLVSYDVPDPTSRQESVQRAIIGRKQRRTARASSKNQARIAQLNPTQ